MTRSFRKLSFSTCAKGAALLLLFFLFSGTAASAGSYTVSYGFEDPDGSEAGKLVCKYEKYCDLELKKGSIALWLDFSDPKHRLVYITILRTDGGPGCCYFEGGVSRVRRDAGSRISLNVFFGRAQRGGLEYVENMRFGVLNLLFSDTN